MEMKIPSNCKMILFDLDNTLIDNKIIMPKTIYDILYFLNKNDIKLGIASLNMEAKVIPIKLSIPNYFDIIYNRSFKNMSLNKTWMFNEIINKFKINPKNILFFDDNIIHIREAENLNIKSVHIKMNSLLTWDDISIGFSKFHK